MAASSCFLSQGLSASAQTQKYLNSSKRYFHDPFFLSLYLLVPTGRLHETSPDLVQPTTKFSGHFKMEARFLLAFPRRSALWWRETPSPWSGWATLGPTWRPRDWAVDARA